MRWWGLAAEREGAVAVVSRLELARAGRSGQLPPFHSSRFFTPSPFPLAAPLLMCSDKGKSDGAPYGMKPKEKVRLGAAAVYA